MSRRAKSQREIIAGMQRGLFRTQAEYEAAVLEEKNANATGGASFHFVTLTDGRRYMVCVPGREEDQ